MRKSAKATNNCWLQKHTNLILFTTVFRISGAEMRIDDSGIFVLLALLYVLRKATSIDQNGELKITEKQTRKHFVVFVLSFKPFSLSLFFCCLSVCAKFFYVFSLSLSRKTGISGELR